MLAQEGRLADALATLAERVHPCAECGNLTEDERCAVCRDPRRDAAVLCAVEEASDIGAIERTGIPFRKGSPQFKAALDKVLLEASADGSLKALSIKWFGIDASRPAQ